MLTEALLRHLKLDAGRWLAPLSDACNRYEIDTDDREAIFLAQCLHESQGFTKLVENMHYSAARLLAVFPRYFKPDEAIAFAYQDARIAERVYGGRMGNGPEGSGDGWSYRGRGLIGATGRNMYRRASINIGPDFEADPSLLEMPTWAAVSAAWIFADEKRCNELADRGQFASITARINGSSNPKYNGMASRLDWLDKVREAQAATC